jgi:hypothetical protein
MQITGICRSTAACLTVLVVSAASAQETVRVRGTIERVDGGVYVVKARDGMQGSPPA